MLQIEIIYLISSTMAIAAMAPQVKQLLVLKNARELNLASWCVWCACQFVATLYGIYLSAIPYIIISSIWSTYYLVMVLLIIKYRRQPVAINTLQPEIELPKL